MVKKYGVWGFGPIKTMWISNTLQKIKDVSYYHQIPIVLGGSSVVTECCEEAKDREIRASDVLFHRHDMRPNKVSEYLLKF